MIRQKRFIFLGPVHKFTCRSVALVCYFKSCGQLVALGYLQYATALDITKTSKQYVIVLRAKTHPCNIQRFLKLLKMKIFNRKILLFFLFFAQNIDCGYTLEPPRRGGSNEYPQSMF